VKKYFIKLEPLTPFFFGGEETFGDGDSKNYFVKSNKFPQQTTLLGMIRKELLIQKRIIKKKYNEDERKNLIDLIGNKSFDISSEEKQDFGIIENISPLFLSDKDNNIYYKAPFAKGYKFNPNPSIKTNLSEKVYFSDKYNPKDGLNEEYISFENSKDNIKLEEIFKEDVRTGINKQKKMQEKSNEKENSLYKQIYYQFDNKKDNKFYFSFILDLNSDFELKDSIVYMGAERSAFKMTVSLNIPELKPENDKNYLYLLSDAYVNEKIYNYCDFVITKTVDFRNIKTSTNNYKYSTVTTNAGTLFFVKNGEQVNFMNCINNSNLQKIGYNKLNKEVDTNEK